MRTKNARAIDALEEAYIHDVKRIHCVVCNAKPPIECHHPEQGLHFCGIGACWDCHSGPHGWHGDKSRWRSHKATEMKAINETRRRVEKLRAGILVDTPAPSKRRTSSTATPKGESDLLPRIVKRKF